MRQHLLIMNCLENKHADNTVSKENDSKEASPLHQKSGFSRTAYILLCTFYLDDLLQKHSFLHVHVHPIF